MDINAIVALNHQPDIRRLNELLRMAQGHLSQSEFAKACGISKSTYSKLLNDKLDTPVTPSILQKIANAQDQVSFEELLNAAGYPPESKFSSEDSRKEKSFRAKAIGALCQLFFNLPYAWNMSKIPASTEEFHTPGLLFHVEVSQSSTLKWGFFCIYCDPAIFSVRRCRCPFICIRSPVSGSASFSQKYQSKIWRKTRALFSDC